jgi:hypothetical protein
MEHDGESSGGIGGTSIGLCGCYLSNERRRRYLIRKVGEEETTTTRPSTLKRKEFSGGLQFTDIVPFIANVPNQLPSWIFDGNVMDM